MAVRFELVPVTVAGAFTCGLALTLMGSIRLPLARRLGLSELTSRSLPLVVHLVLIPAMLLAGMTADRWGVEAVLIGGSLLAAVAVAGLGLSQRGVAAVPLAGLLAVSGAGVAIGSNLLMPATFVPGNAVASVNLGNVFFVLGLLVGPLLAEGLLDRFGFRRTMGLLALFCLTPAVTAALTAVQSFPQPTPGEFAAVLGQPLLWAAALAFLLYGPLESALAGWASPYLRDLGYRERGAMWLVAAFWLVFLAARLIAAFAFTHWEWSPGVDAGFIVLLALLGGVALGNLAGAAGKEAVGFGLLLVGLCLGPILPTLVGLVFERFPNERGTAIGALFSVSALGSAVMLPVIGTYAKRSSVQRALRVPMVVALALAAAVLVFGLLLTEQR